MKARKPALTRPIPPSPRATMSSGRCALNRLTATIQTPSISVHRRSEPSCPPQAPAIRYWSGSAELEFWATYRTEKSFDTKAYTRQPKANATSRATPCAAGRAKPIQVASDFSAPRNAVTVWKTATTSASDSANCPSSGIIFLKSLLPALS